MEAPGPHVGLLDHGWLGCRPCAHKRVETSTVDADARRRLYDEEPDDYVAVAIGFPGTLFIADVCIGCRDTLMRT
jgi:hypothetical protein